MADLVGRVLADLAYYFPADDDDPAVMYLARATDDDDEGILGVTGSGAAVVAKLVRAGLIDRSHLHDEAAELVLEVAAENMQYSPPDPDDIVAIYDCIEADPQDRLRPVLQTLVDYYLAPNHAVWIRRITVM